MSHIKQFFQNIKNPISKTDVFIVSGCSLLGRGLWLYEPWISLSVCGVILILFGIVNELFGGK